MTQTPNISTGIQQSATEVITFNALSLQCTVYRNKAVGNIWLSQLWCQLEFIYATPTLFISTLIIVLIIGKTFVRNSTKILSNSKKKTCFFLKI